MEPSSDDLGQERCMMLRQNFREDPDRSTMNRGQGHEMEPSSLPPTQLNLSGDDSQEDEPNQFEQNASNVSFG